MAVHILPLVFQIRFFEPGKSYDAGDDFVGVMNITRFGRTAQGSMALAQQKRDISWRDMKRLMVDLAKMGFLRFELYRAQGHTVPFGEKVWEDDVEALWRVPLDGSLPFLRKHTVQELVGLV